MLLELYLIIALDWKQTVSSVFKLHSVNFEMTVELVHANKKKALSSRHQSHYQIRTFHAMQQLHQHLSGVDHQASVLLTLCLPPLLTFCTNLNMQFDFQATVKPKTDPASTGDDLLDIYHFETWGNKE